MSGLWHEVVMNFGGFGLLALVLYLIWKDNTKTIDKQFNTLQDLTVRSVEVNTKVVEILADEKEYGKEQRKEMKQLMDTYIGELRTINKKLEKIDRHVSGNGNFSSAGA